MALRHDGDVTAADYADWMLIQQLANEAGQYLALARAAIDRIYSGYGDAFGVLYRPSKALMETRQNYGMMRGIEQMAQNRATLARQAERRRATTPLWLLRPDAPKEREH